jgi:hypothetical protein
MLVATLLIWQMLLMFGMTSICIQITWLKNQKRARFTSTFPILAQQMLMSLNPPLPPLSMIFASAKQFRLLWNVALEIIHLFIVSNLYVFVIIYSSYIGPAYRIFVRDDDGWSVQGRYETIIKRLQLQKTLWNASGKPTSAIRSHLCCRAQIRLGRSPEVQLLPHRPR